MTKDTSGQAFPMPYSTDEHSNPCNVTTSHYGMTLRQWYAGMALQGLLARNDFNCAESAVANAYRHADAMIREGKK